MTDIEILQECRLATMEERALTRQIDRLALICGPRGIGSQAIEPAGDRKTNNATAGQIQQLEGLIERLTRKRDENISIIQRAEEVIDRIRERKDRVVIRCYYVEGQSEYEIADEMDKSRNWVNQRRNVVLDALAMPKRKKANGQNVLK
ncbi:MAG: sigma-70 family RNA polymerase sigma factor [Clostridia bacterium]|nr:sigma-70 family RNA polymerase sigma factor [Clostridia bacterium]